MVAKYVARTAARERVCILGLILGKQIWKARSYSSGRSQRVYM